MSASADVLAQAHRYGLDAVLIIGDGDTPLPADADVVGIAGPARSLGGQEFDDLVRAQLAQIAEAGAPVLLYKVCSTFDSLPTLGSIGRGIELLHERFPGLGPVAVRPDHQGQGVGSALVAAVLVTADQLGEPSVVLLGDPGWYAHFGFETAARHGIRSPGPWEDRYFQVKRLGAWRPELAGPFRYAPAFDRLPG